MQSLVYVPGRCLSPWASRAGQGQRADTGWASRVPALWTAAAGSGSPELLPRSSGGLRPCPARAAAGQTAVYPRGRHRCLLLPRGTGPGPLRVTRDRHGWRSSLRSSYSGSASSHRERGAGPAGGAVPSPARRGETAQRDSAGSARSRGHRRPRKRQHWPSPHRPSLASVSGTHSDPLRR